MDRRPGSGAAFGAVLMTVVGACGAEDVGSVVLSAVEHDATVSARTAARDAVRTATFTAR
jgi:hypothetical protein